MLLSTVLEKKSWNIAHVFTEKLVPHTLPYNVEERKCVQRVSKSVATLTEGVVGKGKIIFKVPAVF